MKNLTTYATGRMPIWQRDFAYMQEAPKEVLLALINELGLGKTNFLISGCTITISGGSVSMTTGWAYFEGDILPVRAIESTIFSGTPLVKLTKVEHYEGQKAFDVGGSAVNRDAYQNDYLKGTLLPITTAENYTFGIRQGAWTLAQRLQKNVSLPESNFTETQGIYGQTIFYKKCGKFVQLKGQAFNDAIGSTFTNVTVAINLPVPAAGETIFPAQEASTSMLKIDANGNLIVSSSSNRVKFNHVVYLCETSYSDSSDGHESNQSGGEPGNND